MTFIAGIRLFIPLFIALVLLVISSVPISIPGLSAFFPVVDIMIIYYWSSYRPGALPDWAIFLLGVLRDGIEGITIGISSCIYLLVKFIVIASAGLYKKGGFLLVWQGFAAAAIIGIAGKWLLVSFVMDRPLMLDYGVMQLMFSMALYPVFHWFFNLINTIMPVDFQDA